MKTVAIVSGGMDSVTMLHKLVKEGHEVNVISFDYRQKHRKELKMAEAQALMVRSPFKVVDIGFLNDLASDSALTQGGEIPEGHYADKNMKKTVVHNRNMVLASIAMSWALNINADAIAIGVHAGDHAIYPDCRPEFIFALRDVAKVADWRTLQVLAPFLYSDKIAILNEGLSMGVDYSKTWTCYKGKEKACGKCGSCTERLEAFEKNNSHDPLEYD